MIKLTVFASEKKEYTVLPGNTVLDTLRKLGYKIDAPCGGNGKCGKCRAKVCGALSPKSSEEKALPDGWRLLCTAKIIGDIEVYLEEDQKAQVEIGRFNKTINYLCDRGTGYGISVDIGTTTVVAYLIRLEDGKCLSVRGNRNSQRPYGADVISRIDFSRNPSNMEKLHRAICDQIEEMITEMAQEVSVPTESIRIVTIAGNNTMELLFAGISPESLAEYPFTSPDLFGHDVPNPFSSISPERILMVQSVQSFVGGDITAAILASQMYQKEPISLLLDIGTNGEMVLGNQYGMLCCATAAGPAFEGANITCGMPGLEGAVDRVSIESDGITYHTIGNQKAVGICGSGLIDLLAVLVRIGAVDETGRLLPPDEAPNEVIPFIEEDDKGVLFRLPESRVILTAEDVRKLQLAKAAIRAGIETLVAEKHISKKDIDCFYLAGGFGCHIDPKSASEIGLFPNELLSKVELIGNGSAEGAYRVSCSEKQEAELSIIIKKCQYVDLSTNAIWNDQYIENMMFE